MKALCGFVLHRHLNNVHTTKFPVFIYSLSIGIGQPTCKNSVLTLTYANRIVCRISENSLHNNTFMRLVRLHKEIDSKSYVMHI